MIVDLARAAVRYFYDPERTDLHKRVEELELLADEQHWTIASLSAQLEDAEASNTELHQRLRIIGVEASTCHDHLTQVGVPHSGYCMLASLSDRIKQLCANYAALRAERECECKSSYESEAATTVAQAALKLIQLEEQRARTHWQDVDWQKGAALRECIFNAKDALVEAVGAYEVALNSDKPDYRAARGVLPMQPGDERPEETIRRIRDAR